MRRSLSNLVLAVNSKSECIVPLHVRLLPSRIHFTCRQVIQQLHEGNSRTAKKNTAVSSSTSHSLKQSRLVGGAMSCSNARDGSINLALYKRSEFQGGDQKSLQNNGKFESRSLCLTKVNAFACTQGIKVWL